MAASKCSFVRLVVSVGTRSPHGLFSGIPAKYQPSTSFTTIMTRPPSKSVNLFSRSCLFSGKQGDELISARKKYSSPIALMFRRSEEHTSELQSRPHLV